MVDGLIAVDVHVHIAPPRKGMYGVLGQSPEQLIERMDRNGIDYSVVFSMVNTAGLDPDSIRAANDYVIEAVRRYPDRLVGLCLTTPRHGEAALEEVRRCIASGLRGIKLHPHLLGYYPIDGEIVYPLVELARELKVPILTHSDANSKRCNPYQVVRLAQRFPDVPIIMAHMGMDSDFVHFVPALVKDVPNVYLDTSDTPNLPEFIFARPAKLIPDRILFGSDGPTLSVEAELKKLEVAEALYGLTREEKARILGLNACQLFGLPAEPRASQAR